LIQFFSIAGVFACVVGGFLLCSWSTKISQIVKVAGRELTEPKANSQWLSLIFRFRRFPDSPGHTSSFMCKARFHCASNGSLARPNFKREVGNLPPNCSGLLTRTALDAGLSGLFLLHRQKPVPPTPLSVLPLRTISENRALSQAKNNGQPWPDNESL
jgi:hypothetical protein